MPDKKSLFLLFEMKIAEMLRVITQSALEAHAAATHSESKSEDQYDTRGLEASYLAGAQSRRVLELEQILNTYRFADGKSFAENAPISSTALIELRPEEGQPSLYLLMPNGGGMSVEWHNKKVQTITPQSPLGSALLGKRVGEEISIVVQGRLKDFEIISVQ